MSVLRRELGIPKDFCLLLLSVGCGCSPWSQKSLLCFWELKINKGNSALKGDKKPKRVVRAVSLTYRVVQLPCKWQLHPGKGLATGSMSKNSYSFLLFDKLFALKSNVVGLYFKDNDDLRSCISV